jgi:hypothetical protein
MSLATAIIGGLVCGYFLGFGRRGFCVFLAVWVAVLAVQTLVVVSASDVGPPRGDDRLYWPVQAIILTIAVLMLWLGAKVRARRACAV